MANIEEIKKIADEKGIELTDEMLEKVAGGFFSEEEWNKLTKAQQDAYIEESMINWTIGQPCILD